MSSRLLYRRCRATMLAALTATMVLLGACASTPYDYTVLRAKQPRSILVLPPLNNSVEVNAPYTFLSTITRPLAEKGYYVFPVAVIDAFMKENGLPTPAEMHTAPLDKLKKEIGADAVLYVTINTWGQKYQILSSKAVVSSKLKLVDTSDGQLLWDGSAYAQQQSNDNGGGLAGALIGAIVDQVAGSLVDHTQALSKRANMQVIHANKRGLLAGPYRPDLIGNPE